MRARRLLLSLLPPPRWPVTWRRALPLVLFLVVFGAVCLVLELWRVVTFARPAAFALAAFAPWVWWMHVAGHGGLRGARAQVALAVRFVLLAALIAVLAEPQAVRLHHSLAVVYAVDLSDSVQDASAEGALKFVVRTVSEKPQRDEAGLVVFGREAAVELPPRAAFPFEAVNSRVSRDGTNIEKGLSLAAAMVPEDRNGRIVLASDGVATEGSLARVLDELRARALPVDVLPVRYHYGREVWLERLDLPHRVKRGETYQATVILSSLQPGSGTLLLTENGKTIARERVDFPAGKSRFDLSLYLREPGFYEYVASIDLPPGQDGWAKNNVAVNHLYLEGKGKVLVVTDPAGHTEDWQPLAEALRRAQREVVRCAAFDFPRDAFSLLPYDVIVFVNVPADQFDAVQLQAVHDAVYHQGTGFLMVGGKNSFGPGGYHRTAVEAALPVTMDIAQKKVLPKGALVIVMHTCEFPEGNTWGKRVAKEAIRVLGARDEVGVLVYDWQNAESWLFPLTPAEKYDELVPLINQAEIGDMPSFQTTMTMGLQALKASDAGMKHMIIISDGDPSPPPPKLVQGFQAEEISISTVAIFPHEGTADVGVGVMRRIAGSTGGRFYHPQDPRRLPSIFIKEAKTLRRSMIQNKDFVPQPHAPGPPLKGLDRFPPLHGLVLTTAKARSTVLLRAPAAEDLDPVLATWRHGIGKAAAFTSDLGSNWGAEWLRWEHYEAFVKQLATDIARSTQDSSLRLRTFAEGSTGVILLEDHHREPWFLEVRAQVSGPRGKSETVELEQVGPRRYRGEFPLWGTGHYQVMASGAGPGRSERALGRFAVPYSAEYLRFRSDPLALRRMVEQTGGRLLTGEEKGADLFLHDRPPKASTRPVADWVLLLLACLLPLDVGVRRVQLDWQLVRGWLRLGRERGPSGETLGALLRRKKQVRFPAREAPSPSEPPPPGAPAADRRPPRGPTAPPPKPAEPPPEEAEPDTSTTRRLLAKKRKWRKGRE